MTDDRTSPATDRQARRPLDEAADWFARLGAGDLSAAEQADFEAWQAADPANAQAYRKVAALWNSSEFAAATRRDPQPVRPVSDSPGPDPTRQRSRVDTSPRRRRFGGMARIAAAALVFVAVGLTQIDAVFLALTADHRTGIGAQERLDLPDGSRMVLNSGSAVQVAYDGEHREVRLLAGEAYFEVTPDPARPFEVTSGEASVLVLGTAFAVRAGERSVTVAVRHGQVAVAGEDGPDRPSVLAAGEALRVTEGLPGETEAIDPEMTLAWLQGRLVFRDRPLGEIVAELNRYHSGWIIIADDRLRSHAVSGNYRLDDPTAAAAALAATASADVVQVTDFLTILH